MTQAFNLSQLANGVDSSGKLDLSTNSKNPSWTTDISANLVTVGKGGGAVSTNTAVGASALTANTTGSYNSAVGNNALSSNTTAVNATALGYNAGYSQTTATGQDFGSTFVGRSSGYLVTGLDNTFVGSFSGSSAASSGSKNNGFGTAALYSITSGGFNTALGSSALYSNTTASSNTAVGYQAGYNFTTSNANTVLGYAAGKGGATGQTDIVCVGAYAGAYQRTATGSGIICIGSQSDVASSANPFEIVIGYNTTGKGASTGFINPNSGGIYQGNNSATWSITSDQRLKKNIVDNTEGLSIISQIRVRNFEYRTAEEVTELPAHSVIDKQGVQLGVIAQELQEVCGDCVKTESTGVMSVNQDNITWHMVNAIKDLKAELDTVKAELAALKG